MKNQINTFIKNSLRLAAGALVLGAGLLFMTNGAGHVNAAQAVTIDEAHFPDPVFRTLVLQKYDTNGNGTLDVYEIEHTMNVVCEGMGIKSLKGIEYFTDVQGVWCRQNDLDSLDVTNLKDLRGLWCSENPRLTSIDLSQNKELTWIYCFDCNLTALDVSHNPHMAYLECNTNPISELNLLNNKELEHLTCGTCNLTSLNLKNNKNLTHLDAFSNHLTSLDVSHNTKLKRLDIWNNPGLKSIDVSMLKGLQYYNCAYNGAAEIDVSKNRELTKLNCAYNNIKKLDLSNNPKLAYLDCACNSLSSLDLSHNNEIRFLQAFINDFKTLDIGYNPCLIKTYNEGYCQYEYPVCYGHSWTIDYGGQDSTYKDHIFFLCFDDSVTLKTAAKKNFYDVFPEDNNEGVTDASNLITREAFVQTLYNMAGRPSVAGLSTRFTDVAPGAWYSDAVIWADNNDICEGYPFICYNTFGVGKYIRRQDVVLMLMRYTELMGYSRSIDFGRSDDYADYFDVDYDHWEAVCWAATKEILETENPNGPKNKQKIKPLERATRSYCENIIRNMLEYNWETVPNPIPFPEEATTGDHDAVKEFVARFYQVILGRPGDDRGLEDWTRQLIYREKNGADVAMGFVLGEEFTAKNLSNDEFVDKMYLAFFGRAADPEGKAGWIAMLNQGYSRAQVLAGFVNSPEFKNLCAAYGINPGEMIVNPGPDGNPTQPDNPDNNSESQLPPLVLDASGVDDAQLDAYVERLYVCVLERPSDPVGKADWINIIKAGHDASGNKYDAAIVARIGFFESDEYKNKQKSNDQFLVDLYRAFFNREPDEGGYNMWLTLLNNGSYSRARVIDEGFGHSEEFKDVLRSFGFRIIE